MTRSSVMSPNGEHAVGKRNVLVAMKCIYNKYILTVIKASVKQYKTGIAADDILKNLDGAWVFDDCVGIFNDDPLIPI